MKTLPPIRQDITYPADYFERRSNESAPVAPPVNSDAPAPTPTHLKPGDKIDGGVLRIALGGKNENSIEECISSHQ